MIRAAAWIDAPAGADTNPGKWKAVVEGKNARILRVKRPDEPLLILLVADMTGDLTLVDPAREALVSQIEGLPHNTWTALLRAQDGLQTLVDPTGERAPVVEALRGLQITGRAGLLESIEPAASLASGILKKSPLRLAVLYVTDSNIYNYREDYTNPVINYSDTRDLSRRFPEALIREKSAKLAQIMAATDAPVFAVHLAFLRDRLNEAYQTGLQQIVEATGGEAIFCRSQAEIPSAIRDAFAKIGSHWAIDIELPQGAPKNLSLSLSAGDETIRHRTKFVKRGK